jgi:hypothetical protein
MKSTHHLLRVVGLALGLALLMVTGTAAMIGTLSTSLLPAHQIALATPVDAPGAQQFARANEPTSDTVLYERVVRSDGSSQWTLVEEPSANLALRRTPEPAAMGLAAIPGADLQRVSYLFAAKPAGLNKAVKNCSAQAPAGASNVYNLFCNTVS